MSEVALAFDTSILSNRGGRESNQDDARHLASPGGGCWVLCDGLGGHGGGETAARIGVTTILQCFELYAECSASALRTYLESARRAVLAGSERHGAQAQHGGTLIEQPHRVEHGHVDRQHAAAGDQPHRPFFDSRGARKEDLQIIESLRVGENEGAAHLLLNYNP